GPPNLLLPVLPLYLARAGTADVILYGTDSMKSCKSISPSSSPSSAALSLSLIQQLMVQLSSSDSLHPPSITSRPQRAWTRTFFSFQPILIQGKN
ncbi:hypothetical protein EI94DRAFT_1740097, partial [Lactarius quietus]